MAKEEGKKRNWFVRHKILTAILVIIVIVIAATSAGGGKKTGTQTSSNTSTAKAKLTLDDGWQLTTPDTIGAQYVDGYVSNNTDKDITSYVQITFNGYDDSGANVGTCLANTNSVDANGKWKFHAICDFDKNMTTVKFKDLSGF